MVVIFAELLRHPDGTEERIGKEPPPLCELCPVRAGRAPVRHIEVIHTVPDVDG